MHLYAYFSCNNCTIQTKNTWKQLEFVAFNFKCKLLVLKSCNMYFKVTQYKYLVLAQSYLRTRYEKLVNNSISQTLWNIRVKVQIYTFAFENRGKVWLPIKFTTATIYAIIYIYYSIYSSCGTRHIPYFLKQCLGTLSKLVISKVQKF